MLGYRLFEFVQSFKCDDITEAIVDVERKEEKDSRS